MLCRYVAYLGEQGLKQGSIKSYLSAVRHAQITAGFPDPFSGTDLSRLECVLKGLKRQQDPFRQGIDIFLGATGATLCPVLAMVAYLALREKSQGPLFVRSNGNPLSRAFLVDSLKGALQQCGVDPTNYNGHSFRIGAATTAAACGIEDATIKMLGRWQSSAYTLYIRTPRDQLASIAARLAAAK